MPLIGEGVRRLVVDTVLLEAEELVVVLDVVVVTVLDVLLLVDETVLLLLLEVEVVVTELLLALLLVLELVVVAVQTRSFPSLPHHSISM